jgi:hypothetical protein
MKLILKASNIDVTIERSYNLRDEPALSYKVENYELTVDIEQLLNGFSDLRSVAERLMAQAMNDSMPVSQAAD